MTLKKKQATTPSKAHVATVKEPACDSKACACGGAGCRCKNTRNLCIIGGGVIALLLVMALCCCGTSKGKINTMIEEYIKNNPQVILDSVDAHLRAKEEGGRQAPAAAQVAPEDMVKEITKDKTNMVLGNPKGKFVIIEFFDYQCGWCKKTNKEIAGVLKDAPNIRWILMDAPIFGPASETISYYALAAAKQGKFKEMHEAIANATTKLDEPALIELGKSIGLNTDKLKKDANSDEIHNKLAKNREYTKALRVGGVPMLIVDGKLNPGALIGDKLQEAVKASNEK